MRVYPLSYLHLFFFLLGVNLSRGWFQPQPLQPRRLALVTGATGRTGKLICQLLVEQGFDLRILARNVPKAKEILRPVLPQDANIEYCQADMGDEASIHAAFARNYKRPVTHVVYTAGGEDANYYDVSYQGVATCAQEAAKFKSVQHMVFVSSAWSTRPYSIASLLFNSLYETIPMACHYMGEQEIRRQAKLSPQQLNYVILRPGGLNQDERYAKKYPEAYAQRQTSITYQQGDTFQFLGPAGRPGMCRSQLAHIVSTAVNVEGCYTVEVTGSGNVDWSDASVYATTLRSDDNVPNAAGLLTTRDENEVFSIHKKAIDELKIAAVAASLAGVGLVIFLGWLSGLLSLVAVDAFIIAIWRIFYADIQL